MLQEGMRLLANILDFLLLVGENGKNASKEIFVANLPNLLAGGGKSHVTN